VAHRGEITEWRKYYICNLNGNGAALLGVTGRMLLPGFRRILGGGRRRSSTSVPLVSPPRRRPNFCLALVEGGRLRRGKRSKRDACATFAGLRLASQASGAAPSVKDQLGRLGCLCPLSAVTRLGESGSAPDEPFYRPPPTGLFSPVYLPPRFPSASSGDIRPPECASVADALPEMHSKCGDLERVEEDRESSRRGGVGLATSFALPQLTEKAGAAIPP
jgi:hypothetical protein